MRVQVYPQIYEDLTRTFCKLEKAADITRTWTKGPAKFEGNEIILDTKRATHYSLFEDPAQHEKLLMDLAGLRNLGTVANRRVLNKRPTNPSLVRDFAWRHGLLWHQGGDDESRETWMSWLVAGYYLSLTISLYEKLREALATGSVDYLKSFLRTTRDTGNAFGAMPEDDEKLLEHASVLIADRVTKGLEGCTLTIVAACSLERGNGKKEGPPGDFRSSINPSSLVAVAYHELAVLIESKAWFKECVGCGELFRLVPRVHHRDRTYCDDTCYDRTRKREERTRKRSQIRPGVQQPCSNRSA